MEQKINSWLQQLRAVNEQIEAYLSKPGRFHLDTGEMRSYEEKRRELMERILKLKVLWSYE